MPKRKHYILTLTAEQDFREAKRWSHKRWGPEQTKRYFADLHQGAEFVAKNIDSIAAREQLVGATGLGVYPVREHYIVYVPVEQDFIIIVSLIRQVRDVPAILAANQFRLSREVQEALKQFKARPL